MDRQQNWIKGSVALGTIEVHMMPLLQQLGRMDYRLITAEECFNETEDALEDINSAMALDEHLTLSYLWVLGAYELVRTIWQRLQGQGFEEDCRRLKQKMNRLRIPLAKMEAAGRHPEDSAVAYPMWNTSVGASWQVSSDVIISRRELADDLIAFGLMFESQGAK